MTKVFPLSLLSIATLCGISQPALAGDANPRPFDTITIFGDRQAVNHLPGSGNFISEEELLQKRYSDIMRQLGTVPGVYVQEEDGYGLRPNIGMRGTGASRSDKVAIMEDGVLAAPAPYASPAAYYFPTFGRMQGIEVLKGSSAVKYGPRTTGGVVNLLSRALPEASLASLDIAAGSDGFGKAHAVIGDKKDNLAGLLELYRYQADGFKTLPTGDDTGFEKNDLLLKLGGDFDGHLLEFKYKYSDEHSDETYLGLTDADYRQDPYQRYSASQLDNMQTRHNAYQLNYTTSLGGDIELHASAYLNDFFRNWYKTGMKAAEASAFEHNPVGNLDVSVKANNRNYQSKGVQAEVQIPLGDHQITLGSRLHKDEMDRFQWSDKYQMDANRTMTLVQAGIPGQKGGGNNRIDSAEAKTLFVHGEFRFDDLILSGGLRYEDITLSRLEYLADFQDRDPAGIKKDLENNSDLLVPALGATYQVNDALVLLAGVQKGYAPASPGNVQQEEEESLNWELGGRFNHAGINGEAILFLSDYDNMHTNCTLSQGCSDDKIGNQYNAGETRIAGLELTLGYIAQAGSFDMPLRLGLTRTDTEFRDAFDSPVWGDVVAGDEMPYVPETQLFAEMGLERGNISVNLSARYNSEIRTRAGQGRIDADERIAGRTVWDMAAHYQLDTKQSFYLTIDNLFDKVYIANRSHAIQVGKPRSLHLGYSVSF